MKSWADPAMRACIRKAFEKAVRKLESAGHANMQVDVLRIDGRRQLEDAKAIWCRAVEAGWL